MSKPPKRPRDPNQLAKLITDIATGAVKDAATVTVGSEGGKARAASMTPERRAEIARRAATKRWGKGQPAPAKKEPV
jgi:hypothetical protein